LLRATGLTSEDAGRKLFYSDRKFFAGMSAKERWWAANKLFLRIVGLTTSSDTVLDLMRQWIKSQLTETDIRALECMNIRREKEIIMELEGMVAKDKKEHPRKPIDRCSLCGKPGHRAKECWKDPQLTQDTSLEPEKKNELSKPNPTC